MANRYFTQFMYSFFKKPVIIAGKVTLSAAGAVVSSEIKGGVLTKTGTGAYLLTLEDKYSKLLSASAHLGLTAEDLDARIGAEDVDGARTVVINTKTEGVNTDPSATATLFVTLVLSNSSID